MAERSPIFNDYELHEAHVKTKEANDQLRDRLRKWFYEDQLGSTNPDQQKRLDAKEYAIRRQKQVMGETEEK